MAVRWVAKRTQTRLSWAMMRPFLLVTVLLALVVQSSAIPAAPQFASATSITQASQAKTVSDPWEKEIRAFEEQDKAAPPPSDAALFIGSSSIRLWKTLASDFPEIPVINRGFGGSEIADSTRFVERIVVPYKPRLIVLYAGSNDINSGKSPTQVRGDFVDFVSKVHASLPDVMIAFISINPAQSRWSQQGRVQEANRLIADYSRRERNLVFLNSYPAFLGPNGMPQKSLYIGDNLHLSAEGYAVWKATLKPNLLGLYRSAKSTK